MKLTGWTCHFIFNYGQWFEWFYAISKVIYQKFDKLFTECSLIKLKYQSHNIRQVRFGRVAAIEYFTKEIIYLYYFVPRLSKYIKNVSEPRNTTSISSASNVKFGLFIFFKESLCKSKRPIKETSFLNPPPGGFLYVANQP